MGGTAEQRPGILRFDRIPFIGHRQPQEPGEPVDPPQTSQNGEASLSRTKKKERREFFDLGGVLREADMAKDADAVNVLYLQPSAIEHFADVTPNSTPQDIRKYYKDHPRTKDSKGSQLLVAELAGEIVGAITIAPEEGLNSVKLNRVVRRADKPGLGVGHWLVREALVRSFLKGEKGYGASSVTIGVILDIEGSDEARRLFKDKGFGTVMERIENRCNGWSNEQGKMVPRDVEMMILKRRDYALRYGMDLNRGTSIPKRKSPSA